MARRASRRIPIEAGSGNVFGDLGLPDAAELDPKVRLAVKINGLIAAQRLKQVTAAARLQVGQPKISALKNYRLESFSFQRLMSFLLVLACDAVDLRRTGEIRLGSESSVTSHNRMICLGFWSTVYRNLCRKVCLREPI